MMIVGFRVLNINDGTTWRGRDLNEILTQELALKERIEAGSKYSIVAVLKGECESPKFVCKSRSKVINREHELNELACEFNDEITLASATRNTEAHVVERLQQLVQCSTSQYTIVIPPKTQEIESGEGCGTWVGAMVYIPNREISQYS